MPACQAEIDWNRDRQEQQERQVLEMDRAREFRHGALGVKEAMTRRAVGTGLMSLPVSRKIRLDRHVKRAGSLSARRTDGTIRPVSIA